jgi:hypothetical protein
MRRAALPAYLVLAASLLVAGCALKDPRDSYAYGRLADGLWDADYDLLLVWNYPTSANQGPLEAPKRFRPERPSIGVPWARRAPWEQPPGEKGASAGGAAGAHDAVAAPSPAAAPAPATAAKEARAADRVDRLARAEPRALVR